MTKGVLTDIGKKKICMAHTGDVALAKITYIAFGSGGVDEDGDVIEPTGDETGLQAELGRFGIDGHSYPEETSCRYFKKLQKTDLVGENISELGLFDSDNDLIAYKTFPPKVKGDDEEFVFYIDEIL